MIDTHALSLEVIDVCFCFLHDSHNLAERFVKISECALDINVIELTALELLLLYHKLGLSQSILKLFRGILRLLLHFTVH